MDRSKLQETLEVNNKPTTSQTSSANAMPLASPIGS